MFLAPLKAAVKVMETVRIWESPEAAAVTAPTWHWLFFKTTEEASGLGSEPAPLSQVSATVPALRS